MVLVDTSLPLGFTCFDQVASAASTAGKISCCGTKGGATAFSNHSRRGIFSRIRPRLCNIATPHSEISETSGGDPALAYNTTSPARVRADCSHQATKSGHACREALLAPEAFPAFFQNCAFNDVASYRNGTGRRHLLWPVCCRRPVRYPNLQQP